jgi:predicted lipid-binding transport protein (Tim44 family)
VDFLSDYGFPAQKMSIVGRGLEGVEQRTGRLTSTAAAGRGAVPGAVTGASVGWLFDWFGLMTPLISGLLLTLTGGVLGALIGAVVGWLTHLSTGGRRDLRETPGFRARSYDLFVDAEHADQATAALRSTTDQD